MDFSGLKTFEMKFLDVAATFLFVFVAVIVPGYIQLHTGISAVPLTFLVTMIYLVLHLALEHKQAFH